MTLAAFTRGPYSRALKVRPLVRTWARLSVPDCNCC